MTTKFAAFFRLTFLYSATTSRFLLLICGGSCIDKSLTPVAISVFAFVGPVGLVLLLGVAVNVELVSIGEEAPAIQVQPLVC